MKIETEVIDRLYLELSQVTKAKTNRELLLEQALKEANFVLRSCYSLVEIDDQYTVSKLIKARLSNVLSKHQSIINSIDLN